MALVDELLKNKEEILIKVLQFMEGKEATTKLKLDGMQFNVGTTLIKLNGEVDVTVVKQTASGKKKK